MKAKSSPGGFYFDTIRQIIHHFPRKVELKGPIPMNREESGRLAHFIGTQPNILMPATDTIPYD